MNIFKHTLAIRVHKKKLRQQPFWQMTNNSFTVCPVGHSKFKCFLKLVEPRELQTAIKEMYLQDAREQRKDNAFAQKLNIHHLLFTTSQ